MGRLLALLAAATLAGCAPRLGEPPIGLPAHLPPIELTWSARF